MSCSRRMYGEITEWERGFHFKQPLIVTLQSLQKLDSITLPLLIVIWHAWMIFVKQILSSLELPKWGRHLSKLTSFNLERPERCQIWPSSFYLNNSVVMKLKKRPERSETKARRGDWHQCVHVLICLEICFHRFPLWFHLKGAISFHRIKSHTPLNSISKWSYHALIASSPSVSQSAVGRFAVWRREGSSFLQCYSVQCTLYSINSSFPVPTA